MLGRLKQGVKRVMDGIKEVIGYIEIDRVSKGHVMKGLGYGVILTGIGIGVALINTGHNISKAALVTENLKHAIEVAELENQLAKVKGGI